MNVNDHLHELIFVGGPPGVGKSTAASEFTARDASAQQIGAGDLIRDVRAGIVRSKYEDAIQKAILKKELVHSEVFSGLLHERIKQADETISLSLINGFPYLEADWNTFTEQMEATTLSIGGFVALNATMKLCVGRMAERGVRKGEQIRVQTNENPHDFYVRRYDEYARKSELITNIFLRNGVPVMHIDANGGEEEVFDKFQATVQLLRKDDNYER